MSGYAQSRTLEARPRGAGRHSRLVYVLGLAPLVTFAVVSLVAFIAGFNTGSLGFDFRGAYLPAAEAVLAGESPYPPFEGPELASHNAYVYPPLLAFVVTPFTAVSESVAAVLAVLLCGALLVATLGVLGVRDPRCYAAMLLWAPTVNSLHMASASVLLAFAAALAWRYRDASRALGASVGLGIAAKLIVWPLLVWTVATRRLRASAWAAALGATVTLALWAVLSFDGLERYPAMMRRLASLEAEDSYSLVGAFASLGVDGVGARAVAMAIGLALVVLAFVRGRSGDDFGSFTLALAASLALSPIVWLHYLVLMLVPLAIARPRFSAIWLVPLLLWLTPLNGNGTAIQPLLPALVVSALVAVVVLARERPAQAKVATA